MEISLPLWLAIIAVIALTFVGSSTIYAGGEWVREAFDGNNNNRPASVLDWLITGVVILIAFGFGFGCIIAVGKIIGI